MKNDMFNDFQPGSIMANVTPLTITEFSMVGDRVARVIVNVAAANMTAKTSLDEVVRSLTASLDEQGAPIANSFSWLVPNKTMIGYIASNRATRDLATKSLSAGYKMVASNLFMDKDDESLWEMRSGAAGQYLARQGHDELSNLIESARVSPKGSTPRMASVISASVAPKEFVAFIYDSGVSQPSVEYGFCTKRGENGQLTVAGMFASKSITINEDAVVSSHQVSSKDLHAKIMASGKVTAAATGAMTMEEYYRTAYSYSPEYVDLIIKQIEQHRVM